MQTTTIINQGNRICNFAIIYEKKKQNNERIPIKIKCINDPFYRNLQERERTLQKYFSFMAKKAIKNLLNVKIT